MVGVIVTVGVSIEVIVTVGVNGIRVRSEFSVGMIIEISGRCRDDTTVVAAAAAATVAA